MFHIHIESLEVSAVYWYCARETSCCDHMCTVHGQLALLKIVMSTSKELTAARLNDLILGLFSRAPTSETLDHAVRYLSTWNGSECVLIQCLTENSLAKNI